MTFKRVEAVSHILASVKKAKDIDEKVRILRENDSETLRYILELAFHPNVGWAIPEGAPPFRKSDLPDLEGRLYKESRTLYIYLNGNRPDITKVKREHLFIQLLESIHPDDADLLIATKDKKVEGLNIDIINTAFPGLIPNEQVNQA